MKKHAVGDPADTIGGVPQEETEMQNRHSATNASAAAAPSRKGKAKATDRKPTKKARATPRDTGRPDGLRPGSKMATMIDMTLRPKGATEAAICEEIGWKKCRVTLKRTAEKAGYDLMHEKNAEGETVWKASVPRKSGKS